MLKRLGSRIQKELFARGWSVEWLAGRSGVARSTLHEIIAGRSNPRFGTLHSIAAALGFADISPLIGQNHARNESHTGQLKNPVNRRISKRD